MITEAVAAEPTRGHHGVTSAGVATVAAYSILGAALVASRVVGLDHSFWTDEVIAVEGFIRAGPREILAGPDLSHELFGLLAWTTRALVGESEVAFRFWSVMPFVVGTAFVTVWLHRRFGALAGVLFLFLATVSPLLLDITRQARGYGLAFFAMSVLVVAALEAERSGSGWWILGFCTAGLVGTTTLPQFGIAFLATGVALLAVRTLRRQAAIALALSSVAIAAWYSPHIGQIRNASRIEDGVRIDTWWLVSAPVDQVLLPALLWIDGTALVAGLVWLPLVLAAVILMGSSSLVRTWATALILCSGVVTTIVVLWLTQAFVIPRYLSYLLVPMFVLLATGMATIFQRAPTRPAIVRSLASVVVLALLVLRFAAIAPDVMRLPREANRDAAVLVLERKPTAAVLLYVRNPRNVEHYLERSAVTLAADDVVTRVCGSRMLVAYVSQPFGIRPVEVPCLSRPGVEHHRFRQYARGGETNVWFIPPTAGGSG